VVSPVCESSGWVCHCPPPAEALPRDAANDSSPLDGGPLDASLVDASLVDASPVEARTTVDAPRIEAGTTDATPVDATAGDQGATLCITTGGTVATQSCCASASDFPDTCAVGACSCPPSGSHSVKVCQCPSTQCYDTIAGCR
jgi:hypothetical protein